jgi:hypothetical protein
MARQSKSGDPAASKYQSTFANLRRKNVAAPKAPEVPGNAKPQDESAKK